MLLTPEHPAKDGNHVIWPVGKDVLRTFNERHAYQLFAPYFKRLDVKYFPPASGKNYITVTGVKK